jgi:hypothetical protein
MRGEQAPSREFVLESQGNMKDEDIDLSETPEVTVDQIAQATLRVGGKPVARGIKHSSMKR